MTTGIPDPMAASGVPECCRHCQVPLASDQRYCLNCGAYNTAASDPVARYFSEATAARARVAAASALAASRRRSRTLSLRMVAVLVAAAVLVGFWIGHATAGGTAAVKAPQSARAHRAGQSQTLKTSTGSSYVQQENNLPNSVTP